MITDFLRSRWHRTLSAVKPPRKDLADAICDQILSAYSEPGRAYHTVEHLMACFQVLDRVFPVRVLDPALPPPSGVTNLTPGQKNLVELALWFHDITYDTHANDNEAQSAEVAMEVLRNGLDLPRLAEPVRDLILATKHDAAPTTLEAQVLVDVDLSILGESTTTFEAYEQQIRAEYAWVPELAYKEGRAKVLNHFLDREWIYSTPEMRRTGYEGRAQDNLRRSLKALGATR